MSDSADFCIPADPDVSGIGVRIAIYAQNILTFIPAFYALWDGVVTHKELDSVRKHSTTILLTAFAILISAYVQASTNHLTNYHTLIVLNLSWMNNTNAFVYALLYVHHNGRSFLSWDAFYARYIVSRDAFYQRYIRRAMHPLEWNTEDLIVFFLGTLHLSMMAILGIWFWRDISSFGSSVICSTQPLISVIGAPVPLDSQILRVFSIALYCVVLVPFLNLLLPMCLACVSYGLWNRENKNGTFKRSIRPISVCLVILLLLNVLFAVDIELTLIRNRDLQSKGEGIWSFGQSLALLMLLPSLWDLGKSLWTGLKLEWEIKMMGTPEEAFKRAMILERLDMIADLTPKVDNPGIEGGRFGDALKLAAHHGDLNLVKLLIDHGLDPDSTERQFGGTALQAAAARGNQEVVDYLIEKKVDVNASGGEFGSALQAAAFAGDAHCVMRLLVAGADRSSRGGRFKTPLHAAVFSESEIVVRILATNYKPFLFGKDRKVSSKGSNDNLSLDLAPQKSFLATLAQVDALGCHPDVRSYFLKTALHHLRSTKNDISGLQFLLKSKANVNSRDKESRKPLHLASDNGSVDIVRVLLENGAHIDSQSCDRTPLHFACSKGHLGVVQLLLENGAQTDLLDERSCSPLHWACDGGYMDIVQLLLVSGAKMDIPNKQLQTPFHWASKNGHISIVELLLERMAPVDLQVIEDGKSQTPLHLASQNGHTKVIHYLIKSGAQVDSRDKKSWTPLHLASSSGQAEAVEILLENGAQVNSQDCSSWTPLHHASSGGHIGIVHRLLDGGAEVDSQAEWLTTPFHCASERGHVEILRVLLEKGAQLDLQDHFFYTSLHMAIANHQKEVARFLLKIGAQVDVYDYYSRTPLHLATKLYQTDIVELLLKSKATLDVYDDESQTPLYLASSMGYTDALQLLLQSKATVDVYDDKSRTPLHLACYKGHKDAVQLLLENEATVDALDADSNTPFYYAHKYGYTDIVQLLLENGSPAVPQDES